MRDTLNLVHELKECGIGVRTLADLLPIDTSNPNSPIAQLAVVMLALFAEMDRTYAAERASQAQAVASANGHRTGRPSVIDADKLEHAALLRDKGFSMKEITAKTGLKRTTLYRHLPPCSSSPDPDPDPVTMGLFDKRWVRFGRFSLVSSSPEPVGEGHSERVWRGLPPHYQRTRPPPVGSRDLGTR